jgi:TonB family protein
VFRISGSPREDRREPTLTGAPRLVLPDPARLAPAERFAPATSPERKRWLGPLGSLVLHLLPLLLLIEWPFAAPPETEPIPVQLVFEPPPPPPPPPPQPVPPKPQFKPPPPGPIASEDLGNTEVKKASPEANETPAAKEAPPPPPNKTEKPTEKTEAPPPPPEKIEPPPPEPPQQTAAIVPPPPPEKPPPPKPQPKPSQATRPVLHWEEEPAHTATRRAKYPGPAATRDEYLAYVHSLIRQHYNLLPLALIGGRRGEAQIEFVVLDDGTIAMIRVRHSSGWPDIDERVEQMIAAVHHVPPLPQWFQGPSMGLVLNLPFPDALRD